MALGAGADYAQINALLKRLHDERLRRVTAASGGGAAAAAGGASPAHST